MIFFPFSKFVLVWVYQVVPRSNFHYSGTHSTRNSFWDQTIGVAVGYIITSVSFRSLILIFAKLKLIYNIAIVMFRFPVLNTFAWAVLRLVIQRLIGRPWSPYYGGISHRQYLGLCSEFLRFLRGSCDKNLFIQKGLFRRIDDMRPRLALHCTCQQYGAYTGHV